MGRRFYWHGMPQPYLVEAARIEALIPGLAGVAAEYFAAKSELRIQSIHAQEAGATSAPYTVLHASERFAEAHQAMHRTIVPVLEQHLGETIELTVYFTWKDNIVAYDLSFNGNHVHAEYRLITESGQPVLSAPD